MDLNLRHFQARIYDEQNFRIDIVIQKGDLPITPLTIRMWRTLFYMQANERIKREHVSFC